LKDLRKDIRADALLEEVVNALLLALRPRAGAADKTPPASGMVPLAALRMKRRARPPAAPSGRSGMSPGVSLSKADA
jgi:hypothetical protein